MKLALEIFGWIFHPIFLTIPAVYLIVFSQTQDQNISIYWTLVSFVFTLIVSCFVLIGVYRGFFNDIDVSNRKQRVILYPFTIGVVILFGIVVLILNGPKILAGSAFFFVVALLVLDFVNTKVKASIHVASVSALAMGLVSLYGGYSYFLFFIIPVVAFVRIYKKKHTLREAVVGAVFGILFTFITIIVVKFIL